MSAVPEAPSAFDMTVASRPLTGSGTYGEGAVRDALNRLRSIQDALALGQLSQGEANDLSAPVVKMAQTATETIARQGSRQASLVNPFWGQIQAEGFVKAEGGNWVVQSVAPSSTRIEPEQFLPTPKQRGSGVNNVLKKAASVGVSTLAGFVGGGSVGALAGAARGVVKNTKTGEAENITLRTTGQAAVLGAVANVAAGVAAKGGAALAATFKGGAAATTATGAAKTGGFGAALKTAVTKIGQFGKSGGLAGNAGEILSGAGSLLKKGLPALTSNLKDGIVPGTNETAGTATADQSIVATTLRKGFSKIKEGIPPGLKNSAEKLGLPGNADTAVSKLATTVIEKMSGAADRSQPTIISLPQNSTTPAFFPLGEKSGGDYTQLLIIAGVALALYIFVKKGL